MKSRSFITAVVFFTVACVIFSGLPTVGQRIPPDVAPALSAIRGEKMLEHVTTLASDKFEGRALGTPGETLTVDYLTGTFTD